MSRKIRPTWILASAVLSLCSPFALPAAHAQTLPPLSRAQIERVEAGAGQPGEQANYILQCMQELACNAALLQFWERSATHPMARYVPAADKVPALFRGTELGNKILKLGAVNNCNQNDSCRSYLVEAVKSLRTLPPDQLNTLFEAQARQAFEGAIETSRGQVERNLEQAIAKAPEGVSPPPAAVPAPVTSRVGPAGTILDFSRDPISGNIFQIATNSSGNRELQRRASNDREPTEVIARISGREGKWLIEPSDTTQPPFDAVDVQLTARGFVAGTRSKMQSYEHGRGWTAYRWPAGFEPAAIQRGDVPGTGFVLLERQGSGGDGQLGSTVSQLGYLLGANKRNDYVLLDLHSGSTSPINISSMGKQVSTTTMYNCKRRNSLVNVCRDADVRSQESLVTSLGMKNLQHYAWGVYWFRTPNGTYLVALEDGGRNATVTWLEQGDKRLAFNRALGWADFSAEQADDGHVSVLVGAAFQTERIDNVADRFGSLPSAREPR